MNTSDTCLIMFLKYPIPGVVKQRLAQDIGEDFACKLYECFVIDELEHMNQTRLPLQLWYAPPGYSKQVQQWLGDQHQYFPQRGENLGMRMYRAFTSVFHQGFTRAILVGSDLPDLPITYLTQAVETLENNDAVIGPSSDGGYYLIGLKKDTIFPEVFDTIEWGTSSVFEKTLSLFAQHHRLVAQLPIWYDIDTLDDIHKFIQRNHEKKNMSACTWSFLERHQEHIKAPDEIQKLLTEHHVSSLDTVGGSQ